MRPTLIMGLAAVFATTAAAAQEVTLRAVSAFAEKTTYSRGFELFIERVNRDGKGVLQRSTSPAWRGCRTGTVGCSKR